MGKIREGIMQILLNDDISTKDQADRLEEMMDEFYVASEDIDEHELLSFTQSAMLGLISKIKKPEANVEYIGKTSVRIAEATILAYTARMVELSEQK